ncbi:MAG TPA: class I SAM-dependent methyltransferase [Pirellulales bacterium]|jgi:ubiquinone/menaquinone biosynthesis C-methylase UbiE|nr:class I SAM-dependent methyltransferase [Pirellulales bacterium]
MSRLAKKLRAKLVDDQTNDWRTYHKMVASLLRPGIRVLDVGCGVGHVAPFPWDQYPDVEVIGIDPNPEANHNTNLNRFELLKDFSNWPVEDNSIDLVLSRYVLEHVENPEDFFANLTRVLKPGGQFIALTPNHRHPAVICSGILPLRVKQRILKATTGVQESDVFPTWYRINTLSKLRRYAQKFDLQIEHLDAREYGPTGYLDFNVFGFLVSYTYYEAVRWLFLERWFGASITVVLRKPGLNPKILSST